MFRRSIWWVPQLPSGGTIISGQTSGLVLLQAILIHQLACGPGELDLSWITEYPSEEDGPRQT